MGKEGELQKEVLFYEGTQKFTENINTALLSQEILSVIV